MDFQLLFQCGLLDFWEKLEFLAKKYYLLAKHSIKKYSPGNDFIFLKGEKIFYDSRFGLAGYQGMLTTQLKLLKNTSITSAKIIIDVGANVGFFSKLCRKLYPLAQIYAVEPISETYKCLEMNFPSDKKIKLFNQALAQQKGHIRMAYDRQNSAISRLDESGPFEVVADTLDNLVFENGIKEVDILKIDVEGLEAQVLRGGKNTLAITRNLFLEITIEDNNNYTFSSLLKLLCLEEYEYQLVAYRNFADKSFGQMPIMEAWLRNIKIK